MFKVHKYHFKHGMDDVVFVLKTMVNLVSSVKEFWKS